MGTASVFNRHRWYSLLTGRWLPIAVALAFQLIALARLDGYMNGDAVEYLDRAARFVEGHPPDPSTSRTFTLSAFLTPLFAVARVLGIEDLRWAPWAGRLLQMLVACFLVDRSRALTARLFGTRAAILAAWLLACSPLLHRWDTSIVSGIPSALALVLALLAWLPTENKPAAYREGGRARRQVQAGAWLGLAVLIKYQLVVSAAVLLVCLPLLESRMGNRGRRAAARALAGFLPCLLLQCLVDQWAYGTFGSTLLPYLKANFGPPVIGLMHPILPAAWTDALVRVLYPPVEVVGQAATVSLRSLTGPGWYFTEAGRAFTGAEVALFVLGGLVLLPGRRPASWTLLVLLAVNIAALSLKSSKEFRLWLPFLPLLYAAAGYGAVRLGEMISRRLLRISWVVPLGLLLAWSAARTLAVDLRPHGDYSAAIRRVAVLSEGRNGVVLSGFPWAIAFQAPPGLEVLKPEGPMHMFGRLLDADREEILAFLAPRSRVLFDPGALTAEQWGPDGPEREARIHSLVTGAGGTHVREVWHHGRLAWAAWGPPEALESMRAGLDDLAPFDSRLVQADWVILHRQMLADFPNLAAPLIDTYEIVDAFHRPGSEERLDVVYLMAPDGALNRAWPILEAGPEGPERKVPVSFDAGAVGTVEFLGWSVDRRYEDRGWPVVSTWWRLPPNLEDHWRPMARLVWVRPGVTSLAAVWKAGEGLLDRDGDLVRWRHLVVPHAAPPPAPQPLARTSPDDPGDLMRMRLEIGVLRTDDDGHAVAGSMPVSHGEPLRRATDPGMTILQVGSFDFRPPDADRARPHPE